MDINAYAISAFARHLGVKGRQMPFRDTFLPATHHQDEARRAWVVRRSPGSVGGTSDFGTPDSTVLARSESGYLP
jgi:hypothetical protein